MIDSEHEPPPDKRKEHLLYARCINNLAATLDPDP